MRDDLICDLAETYGVHEWRELSVETLRALACGLGANSRIQQKKARIKVPFDMFLMAHVVDALNILIWQRTKDGERGRRRPKSLAAYFTEKEDDIEGFDTVEEFNAAMRRFEGL